MSKVSEETQCPRFKCDQAAFENLVFCHKNKIDNVFEVQLKNCATFNSMSSSNFWGKPSSENAQSKEKYCHHELNRCMSDPYLNIVDKKPGDTCINNYECLSKQCSRNEGASDEFFYCQGLKEKDTCTNDTDCNIGLFCNSKTDKCEA